MTAAHASLTETIAALDQRYVLPVYRRQPILFVRGEGARLYDEHGNAYLDFLAGIAVCNVGHCHPKLVQRIAEQAARLMHVSNFFLTEPQARLAQRLCELSGMEKAFFANSGAEACEMSVKVARKYANAVKRNPDYEILAIEGSFHGRTMGALSATMQAEVPDAVPTAAAWLSRPAPQRHRRAARGVQRAHGGDPAGADSGRGGRLPACGRVPARGACAVRPLRRAAGRGRGAGGLRAHGTLVRLPARWGDARYCGDSEGAGRRIPDWRVPAARRRR
jgi:4-aminobutyrate aminotransferase-like enzyme